MQSNRVSTGDAATAPQYDNLRDDAYAASMLRAHQQTTPGMTLYVELGAYYIGAMRVLFAGGSTPTFTAPVSNPRIDLLTINSSGVLAIVEGTEAASPAVPAYPANVVVLCEVYHVVGETAIYTTNNSAYGWTSAEGYIQNDVRPAIAPVYVSSLSQVASGLFIADPGSEATGDMLYYNGSAWTLLHRNLPTGSNINYLGMISNGAMGWAQFTPTTRSIVNSPGTLSGVSGTTTIAHNFGMTPNKVRITARAAISGTNASMYESVGSYDVSPNTMNCIYSSFVQASSNGSGTSSSSVLYLLDIASSNAYVYATITVDSTNIYLAWSKVGSPGAATINLLIEVS